MAKRKDTENIICRNRRAGLRFEVLETLECGVVLMGTEVKSARLHNVSLEESYARIEDGELWLVGCYIAPYPHGHVRGHEPNRRRKLLARSGEIRKLGVRADQRGLSLVPLRMYFSDRGIAKVALAVARGKKVHDKRETLKARDHRREMDRELRGRR